MFPTVFGAAASVEIWMSPQFVVRFKPVIAGRSVGALPKTMLFARGVAGVSQPAIGALVDIGAGAVDEVGDWDGAAATSELPEVF